MTERLYYNDSYTLEFSARVHAVQAAGDARHALILDRSYFYPTSGGQLHDLGTIDGLPVVDVMNDGDRVLHIVQGEAPAPGSEIHASIDGTRRAHHRQQHSGQHLLSRVLDDRFGWATVSSRLGESMNTLEIAATELSREQCRQIEDLTNEAIWSALPVQVRYLEPDEISDAGLRRKVKKHGTVRVIEFADFERCACGGTHVANSAEVGLLVICGVEKFRGGTRIHFLCGHRAVRWRRERGEWLEQTALELTCGQDLVPGKVERLQKELRQSSKQVEVLSRELVHARAPQWYEARETVGRAQVVMRELSSEEINAAPDAAAALVERAGEDKEFVAVLVAREGDRTHVVVAGTKVDCGALLRTVLTELGGKGGGRPDFARGGCAGATAAQVFAAMRVALESESDHAR